MSEASLRHAPTDEAAKRRRYHLLTVALTAPAVVAWGIFALVVRDLRAILAVGGLVASYLILLAMALYWAMWKQNGRMVAGWSGVAILWAISYGLRLIPDAGWNVLIAEMVVTILMLAAVVFVFRESWRQRARSTR